MSILDLLDWKDRIDHRLNTSLGQQRHNFCRECACDCDLLRQRSRAKNGTDDMKTLAEDLKEKPRLRIARQLLKWGRRPPDLLVRERVRVAMAKQPFVTWGMAIDGAFGPAGIRALSRLTLQGTLGCDADDCIDRFTRFFPRAAEGRC